MKLQDMLCASFAELIHSYKVEMKSFNDDKLTLICEDKTFYNELLLTIEDDNLHIKVDRIKPNTFILY